MGNTESRETSRTRASTSALSAPREARAAADLAARESSNHGRRSHSLYAADAPSSLPVEAGGIERGQQATEDATGQLGYWYLIRNGYNELVNLIIRPPRASYTLSELGPGKFDFAGRSYIREDFEVLNDRRQRLKCSHWRPVEEEIDGCRELPCVIYLHGNSSCRLEALSVLRTCLVAGITVVAFDCAGSGLSDGEFISLGYYERDDLRAVMDYLRAEGRVSTIGLWGRSMGAATALLHADRDPSIAALVVDSAFTNLEQLVQEIVEHGRREGYTIPAFLVKVVMRFIRSSVQKRAQFDIKELSPMDHAHASFVPALFVAGKSDEFIAPHHADQLYEAYAGDKNIVKVRGDHNSVRPQFLLDSAGIFLQTALHVAPSLLPDTNSPRTRLGGRPPWEYSSPRVQMMNLSTAFSGRYARLVPRDRWKCKVCTFLNEAYQMQCEVCRRMYEPPEGVPSGRRGRRGTLEDSEEEEEEEEQESEAADGDQRLEQSASDEESGCASDFSSMMMSSSSDVSSFTSSMRSAPISGWSQAAGGEGNPHQVENTQESTQRDGKETGR